MAVKKPSRHNQERILFVLMGLIIVGLILSGYFLVRKISPNCLLGRKPRPLQPQALAFRQ